MGAQRATQHAVQRMLRVLHPRNLLSPQTDVVPSTIVHSRLFTSLIPARSTFSSHPIVATPHCCSVREALRRATHRTTHVRTFFGQRQGYTNFDPSSPVQLKAKYRGAAVGYVLLGIAAATGGVTVLVVVSNQQEVPYSHRRHVVLTSSAYDLSMGTQAFNMTKAQALAEGTLLPDHHKAVRRVGQVVAKIANVTGNGRGGGYQDHLKDLDWEVVVINSPDTNAGALPGGKFVVFTGLLRLLDDEDELAAVIAHEVAHVVARHHAERIATQSVARFVTEVVQLVAYALTGFLLPLGIAETLLFLRYSRQQEHEADIIGMHLAAQACYDPAAGARVFVKLEHVAKSMGMDRIPKYLRTHPLDKDRIRMIKDEVPNAMLEFQRSGCDLRDQFVGAWGGKGFQSDTPTLDDGWSAKPS